MVDESAANNLSLKMVPSSIQTKPFNIEPGMHHLEKLDSSDSIHDEAKDNNKKPKHNVKKGSDRLEELR